ncbi:hypothetical protein D3C81_1520890 [compost metagenome]
MENEEPKPRPKRKKEIEASEERKTGWAEEYKKREEPKELKARPEFERGSWVKGLTRGKQEVSGFVRGIGRYSMTITAMFPEEARGSTITVDKIDMVVQSSYPNESMILGMIDLALDTWDEEWFKQLNMMLEAQRYTKQIQVG